MEVNPEIRAVISLLKYLKVQLWKRGEGFSVQPQKVEAVGRCVLPQNEKEDFYYHSSLHMERGI